MTDKANNEKLRLGRHGSWFAATTTVLDYFRLGGALIVIAISAMVYLFDCDPPDASELVSTPLSIAGESNDDASLACVDAANASFRSLKHRIGSAP